MDVYTGTILIVGYDWAPRNFLSCEGQVLSINQYQALYSLIGSIYGGDQNTKFNLPNLIGRAPIGKWQSKSSKYPIGTEVGASEVMLTNKNIPPHVHDVSFEPSIEKKEVTIPSTTGTLKIEARVDLNSAAPATKAMTFSHGETVYLTNASATSGTNLLRGPYTLTAPADTAKAKMPVVVEQSGSPSTPETKVMIDTITGGKVTMKPSGEGAAFSVMQPSLALNFVMAVQGFYPDRP